MLCSTPAWVKDAVFYEIFPERFANGDPTNDPQGVEPWGAPPTRTNFFGGDLEGIIGKLDYLKALGVSAVYLTPIFAANTNHKYDTVDYYRIDPHFGDLETFRHLVREMHRLGMRIVLDAVFNHVGDGFLAFRDVIERGEASPYVNWFYIEDLPVSKEPTPNYATYENADYLVRINIHNPEVRRYVYDVARYWSQEGIDGWRLDVPCLMNHRFWKGFRRAVKEINSDLYIVGEIWEQATDWLQGDECDGAMNYRLRDLVLDFFVHETLDAPAFDRQLAALRSQHPGESVYAMLNLLGSHDTPRFLTLCRGDQGRLKLGVAFLFSYLGAPMIYYGDEVGMVGENDPGCRQTMMWEATARDQGLWAWHHQLIQLREAHPALRRGDIRTVYASGNVHAFERYYGTDRVLVVLSRGSGSQLVHLPDDCWHGAAALHDELSGRVHMRGEPLQMDACSALMLIGGPSQAQVEPLMQSH